MTTITSTCAGCGRQLTVPDRYQGRDLKCPTCGRSFRVEAPHSEPVLPQASPPPPEITQTLPFASAPFEEPPAPAQGSGDAGVSHTEVGEGTTVYWRVKRIGVLSLAALSALVHAVLGLLIGLAVAVASFTPAGNAIPLLPGPLVGALAIVLVPLAYGAMGFVLGAVMAAVYNLAARLVGGVTLLLE